MTAPELPELTLSSPEELERWLAENHATAAGVRLRLAKKKTGIPSISWAELVDVVLCFGWIDGQAKRIDDSWFHQRITPRRKRSMWSKVNREKVERLIDDGRMRPAGIAEIERAKEDGRWDAAYDAPSTAVVPEDLQAALDAKPKAAEAFAGLTAQNRYAILHRVQTAKKPETRARRIAKFADELARGEKPYP